MQSGPKHDRLAARICAAGNGSLCPKTWSLHVCQVSRARTVHKLARNRMPQIMGVLRSAHCWHHQKAKGYVAHLPLGCALATANSLRSKEGQPYIGFPFYAKATPGKRWKDIPKEVWDITDAL
eukprot:2891186-Amphidinium_carterae.1